MSDTHRVDLYKYCPRCGRPGIQVRSHQNVRCSACDLDLYQNPCAAAAGILLDAENRLLLVERARDPARGKLAFPGGFVDDGESAEDGLRREIREELGIELGALEFLCSRANTYPYAGVVYPVLDVFFVARLETFEGAKALDGIESIVIKTIDEIRSDELAFESLRAAWPVFLERYRPGSL